MEHYRQGDVLLIRTSRIPKGAKKSKDCVLALGEATGHMHQIKSGAQQFIAQISRQIAGQQVQQAERYVNVTAATAVLTHEEHGPITLPKGKYKVRIQREYQPEGNRLVMD